MARCAAARARGGAEFGAGLARVGGLEDLAAAAGLRLARLGAAGAEAQGFRRHIFNDVVVQVGARININFSLQVGAIEDAVDVLSPTESLLTGTASVGGVPP